MRSICLVLGGLLLATAARGDVRMRVQADGTKVIYNVGSVGRGTSAADLEWLAARHDRPSKFDPIIDRWAAAYGVDATLVRAVIQVESGFDPAVVSAKGARGLMQLMPGTAKRFGVTRIHDPEQNIRGGIRYLSILIGMFGDLPRALAAYNAGENAVLRHGGIPPYAETEAYVKRALTVYYGTPYGGAAVSFAGRRNGGPKLKGGFSGGTVAAAMIPGAKYLGSVN